jgi:hypothetical protein
MKTKRAKPQRLTIAGKRLVMLEEPAYEELARKADQWEPPLPEPDERGGYPLEALDVLTARKIPRSRQAGMVPSRACSPRRHPSGNPQSHRTGRPVS